MLKGNHESELGKSYYFAIAHKQYEYVNIIKCDKIELKNINKIIQTRLI